MSFTVFVKDGCDLWDGCYYVRSEDGSLAIYLDDPETYKPHAIYAAGYWQKVQDDD